MSIPINQLYPNPSYGSPKLLMGSGAVETVPGAANQGYESYMPDNAAIKGSNNSNWMIGAWGQTDYLSQSDTVAGISDALYGSPVYALANQDGTAGLSVYSGSDGYVFNIRQSVANSTSSDAEEDLYLSTLPLPQASPPLLSQPIQVSADVRVVEADATLPGTYPEVYGSVALGVVVTFNSAGLALSATDERALDTVFLQSTVTNSHQQSVSGFYLSDTADSYTRTAIYDDPAGIGNAVPFMAAGTPTAVEWNVNALLKDFLATKPAGFEDPAFQDMSRWSFGGIYLGSDVGPTEQGIGFQGAVNLDYQLSNINFTSDATVSGSAVAVPTVQPAAPVFDFLDANTGWSGQVNGTYIGDVSRYLFTGTDNVTLWCNSSLAMTDPGNSYVSGDTQFMVNTANSATTISGMEGTVTVHAGASAALVVGGTGGHNRLIAGPGATTLCGAQSDVMAAGSGTSLIFSGSGASTVFGSGGAAAASTVVSSTGNDLIAAGSGQMLVFTGNGEDTVFGGSASSATVMVGGVGPSVLVGGGGADTIWGGSGPTSIYGGTGDQLLAGGSGDATITGGSGRSTLLGGSGPGALVSGPLGSLIFGGTGSDTIFGPSAGTSTIAGSSTGMLVIGSTGHDVVWGGSGQDTFYGGTGGDFLATGSGTTAVVLSAVSQSEDTVHFGSGDATVNGGSGTAIYQVENGSAGGTDLILGFKPGVDQVVLTGYGASPVGQQSLSSGPGGTTLSLADGTNLIFAGLGHIDAAFFTTS